MKICKAFAGIIIGLSILCVGVNIICINDFYIVLNSVAFLMGVLIVGSVWIIGEDIENYKITKNGEFRLYAFGIFVCICTLMLFFSMVFATQNVLGY